MSEVIDKVEIAAKRVGAMLAYAEICKLLAGHPLVKTSLEAERMAHEIMAEIVARTNAMVDTSEGRAS